jgi:hypothetical protein
VVNHLKSKGSPCGSGDDSQEDGQANCNGTRQAAAAALMNWLTMDPTDSGDPDVLVIGDLNAYAKEDPISTIIAAGYTDLIDQFIGEQAYTFVFDGQLGYLDHALANSSLAPQVTGTAVWHINADEVNVFDYNDDVRDSSEASFEEEPDGNVLYEPNAFRSSDHDPVVVGLNLTGDRDGDGVLNDMDACPMTPAGEVVDPSNGCSLSQLVPCDGPFGTADRWRNHGEYVSSVARQAKQFVAISLIPKNKKGAVVSAAAKSSCGR